MTDFRKTFRDAATGRDRYFPGSDKTMWREKATGRDYHHGYLARQEKQVCPYCKNQGKGDCHEC